MEIEMDIADALMKNRWTRMLVRIYYVKIKNNPIKLARLMGVKIGKNCRINGDPYKIFGSEPWLISLGNHVQVTSGAAFLSHEGAIWVAKGIKPELEKYDKFLPIKVGNNVMLGTGCLIMPGITIGDNVIIAARSVVTKDVPSNTIVGGVPARPISNMEQFLTKAEVGLVETKYMTALQKKEFLMKHKSEWFE